jgi:hypothetical protein
MNGEPRTRYHAEIKVPVEGREARINVFADTLNEIFADLAKIALQFDDLHLAAKREILNAELKANQLKANGTPVPKPQPAPKPKAEAKPVCQTCGSDEAMELIKWTDKKTGEPRQAWKCQACELWHFPGG